MWGKSIIPQVVNTGRKRRFCRRMGVLDMPSSAAPDAAENDGPFCRLTLTWIVFHSWRTFVSSPLSHWSDSGALSSRPRSDKAAISKVSAAAMTTNMGGGSCCGQMSTVVVPAVPQELGVRQVSRSAGCGRRCRGPRPQLRCSNSLDPPGRRCRSWARDAARGKTWSRPGGRPMPSRRPARRCWRTTSGCLSRPHSAQRRAALTRLSATPLFTSRLLANGREEATRSPLWKWLWLTATASFGALPFVHHFQRTDGLSFDLERFVLSAIFVVETVVLVAGPKEKEREFPQIYLFPQIRNKWYLIQEGVSERKCLAILQILQLHLNCTMLRLSNRTRERQ